MTTAPKKIRVLVAEDSPFTRLGIVTMLSTAPDIEVVAQAEDGEQAVVLFRTHRPDLALVDMRMPGLDGVEVTQRIRAENPPGRVLVLTNYDGEETIFKALKAGATGYLTKGASGDELLGAIRAVAVGKKYYPREIAERLADRVLQPTLSGRELQVLQLIFAGLDNQAIADRLSLSKKTVSMFVSKILFKLGARTRAEAVSVGLARGILEGR